MKRIILIISILIATVTMYPCFARNQAEQSTKVYEATEQMPRFPGGEAALYKFIADSIRYPQSAIDNHASGIVVIRFIVRSNGKVDNIGVARSKNKDLETEAIRLVKSLPGFIPGRQKGVPVDVWYTLPIHFNLPR